MFEMRQRGRKTGWQYFHQREILSSGQVTDRPVSWWQYKYSQDRTYPPTSSQQISISLHSTPLATVSFIIKFILIPGLLPHIPPPLLKAKKNHSEWNSSLSVEHFSQVNIRPLGHYFRNVWIFKGNNTIGLSLITFHFWPFNFSWIKYADNL